jgi:glycosyltransferase involved in cell wall biosynthesis
VALLSPVFWPEVRRGSERFARDLADTLLARGHQPVLITSHRSARRSVGVEDGLTVIRNPRPPDRRLERRMFEHHLTHVPFSYLSLCGGDYDIAHALYPTDALAANRWRSRTGRPSVLSYMGIAHRRGLANRRWRPEITLRAMRGADAVVVLSRAAADACERWLGVAPRVIPPGVDLESFAPGPSEARDPRPTIVCPAALDVPRKRVSLLLEAFSLVRRSLPDARLVLSGRGPAPDDGVELADLDSSVALRDAYRAAWVCALPSLGEAFGLVAAEALACGTPVVASDDGALPELVDSPRIGRLFGGDEPGELARALLEGFDLAGEPATADACRDRVLPLSREATAERYLALYAELGVAASAP